MNSRTRRIQCWVCDFWYPPEDIHDMQGGAQVCTICEGPKHSIESGENQL